MLHRGGLDGIRIEGGRTVIGAMVPVRHSSTTGRAPRALARHIADAEVRRSATVGGNLCAPAADDAQRGDLGAPLIALGARVRTTGAGGERTEAVEDFLAGDRSGRLVLEVEFDAAPANRREGHAPPARALLLDRLGRRGSHRHLRAPPRAARGRPDGGALPRPSSRAATPTTC